MKPNFPIILFAALFATSNPAIAKPKTEFADTIYINGKIYTSADSETVSAFAIKDGKFLYVGDNAGAQKLKGKTTTEIDMKGNFAMPGIIDGHMHPQSAGLKMRMCSLNYEALTMPQMLERIQACLDKEKDKKPNDWLVVINWFEQGMLPSGFSPNYKDLEGLKTDRPVYVKNSFGHAAILNKKGMDLVDLQNQKDRAGGIIVKDKEGKVTGRLEDAARDIVSEKLPKPDEAENLAAASDAIAAMNAQGITTILDAYTDIETMASYKAIKDQGKLTLRPHFAVLIDPDLQPDNQKAIDDLLMQRKQFNEEDKNTDAVLKVHTAKMFLDGVIPTPSLTGFMHEPYFENFGTKEKPEWLPGTSTGVKPYIDLPKLTDLTVKLSDAGIDTHIHADGDGAVKLALDAHEAMKKQRPDSKVKTAIAHAELVDPDDFARFGKLGVYPVLSFQWGKPAADTIDGAKDVLGPYRHAIIEPQGLLKLYGADIVFGSDWPVDPLDEFLALQVALTRRAMGEDAKKFPGRLGIDPGLDIRTAINAMTINGATALGEQTKIGSIEKGKFADFIVLDKNLLTANPETISQTKVLWTVLAGKIVYQKK